MIGKEYVTKQEFNQRCDRMETYIEQTARTIVDELSEVIRDFMLQTDQCFSSLEKKAFDHERVSKTRQGRIGNVEAKLRQASAVLS